VELGVQVRVIELVKTQFEIGHFRALAQAKRVEIGTLMAAHTESVDHAQHARLLGIVGHFRRRDHGAMARQRLESLGNRAVTGVVGRAVKQLAERTLPIVGHGLRIVEKLLVELLDICRIEAGQMGGPVFLFQIFAH